MVVYDVFSIYNTSNLKEKIFYLNQRLKKMIYTVTFNPCLDYIVNVDDFKLGRTNRTTKEQLLAGGKGINVSTVLQNLEIENTALGFIAGFTGDKLVEEVEKLGFKYDFIRVEKGFSRINVKLKDFDGTEINGMGPDIDMEAVNRLFAKLDQLESGDTLVLAGSIPACMPDSIYRDIMARLSGRGINFVVDATKDLLLNVLEFKPFLIKPNNHELGEIFGVELKTRAEVVPYARKLREMGAGNVLVSMAGEGAVLVDENDEIHMHSAPKGKLVNAVGAGDSMVAGFIAGWHTENNYEHAFKMGISAGSASAFSELLATKPEIQEIYNSIN